MHKFRFTVIELATGKTYSEYEEMTHFAANSYGLKMVGEARGHGLRVTWCKVGR